jgi:hypothetical protein
MQDRALRHIFSNPRRGSFSRQKSVVFALKNRNLRTAGFSTYKAASSKLMFGTCDAKFG